MNTATHHVGAENKINNVDHWTYSANGCPNCYYSVTDNEQFIGVPGVSYPWNWDGAAICSIVGGFFGSGGGGSIPGCVAPSKEVTADNGFYGGSFRERFVMTLSDTAQDTFAATTSEKLPLLRAPILAGGPPRACRNIRVSKARNGVLESSEDFLANSTSGGTILLGGTFPIWTT
jgi:hypothetical protein